MLVTFPKEIYCPVFASTVVGETPNVINATTSPLIGAAGSVAVRGPVQ